MGKFIGRVDLLCTVTVELDATTRDDAECELDALIATGREIGLDAITDDAPGSYGVICANVTTKREVEG